MFGLGDPKIKEFTKPPKMKTRDDATAGDDTAGPQDEAAARARRPHEGHVLIGEGVKVVGEVRDCRKLEILGTVEGDLEAEELVVHEYGLLKGSIRATTAEVNGAVDGDISVTHRLVLKSKGSVAGNVQYGEISIEAGGRIVGIVDDRADRPARPARPANTASPEGAVGYGFKSLNAGSKPY